MCKCRALTPANPKVPSLHRYYPFAMSSAIVLLNLTTWAEQHISALYAATPNNFNTTFDEFISSNAKITLNGQSLSSDQYKGVLFSHQFEISGATVNYNGAVQVSDPSNPTLVRPRDFLPLHCLIYIGDGGCWHFLRGHQTS